MLLAVPFLAATATAAAPDAAAVRAAVDRHLAANRPAVLRELVDFLALPNLAADDAAIRRNAAHLVKMLEARGVAARLLEGGGGPPAVYGELRTPGARRTVLFYAHYDGQPVHRPDWASDPWTPALLDRPREDGGRAVAVDASLTGEARLYARSASDDKAPIVAMVAALDALRSAGIAPSVNLKFFFEGEEEAGSSHLRPLLEAHRELLKADVWLLCDGPVHQSRAPQLFFGARGVMGVELTLYGPLRPLHSGHYGNFAPNPALELARLLAGLRDDQGRITIAGFHDDVRPPTEAERAAAAKAPPMEDALRHALGLGRTLPGRLEEGVLGPALNVRGIAAGRVGDEAANAIATQARASVDFRLVPDQRPEGVRARLEAHLRQQGYTVVTAEPTPDQRRAHAHLVRLEWDHGYPAARTPLDSAPSRAVSRVASEATGAPVLQAPTLGGSLPLYLFTEVLGVPAVGVPIVNHDNNQHGANENVRLQNLWDGIGLFAALMARLDHAWE
jgi:acetylornithine deacetylase/succinyl-diaminopimelate desuccinylase-like protein